jgi:transglutaminase-like putative cysteine protease
MFSPRLLCATIVIALAGSGPAPADSTPVKSRTFLFTYDATVTGLSAGKTARIWLPVAPVTAEQDVEVVSKTLPGDARVGRDAVYGNPILSTTATANGNGKIVLQVVYKVTRREVRTAGKDGIAATEAGRRIQRFLQADVRVPVGGKSLELVKNTRVPEDPFLAGRVFYDVVNRHMTYAKDTPGWGNGDADWACKSGRGNCSDFHSLFISLARSRKIPAKFEMGFPLPPKRGAGDIPGYHCWAWFMPRDKTWVPVDISEANKNPKMAAYYFGNLTASRVLFTTGRDIELVPRQAGPALNFFIYPYVEVDGKPYTPEKVQKKFSFKDVDK